MKKIGLFLLILPFAFSCFAQQKLNLELFGTFNRGDDRYSGSWAYIGPDGSEYALLGTSSGIAVYSIDHANAIEELGFIPGPTSNWREITVMGQYAFVSTEGAGFGTGMQVIDLSDLPNGISLVTTYAATFTRGHIIQRDIYSQLPYVYVMGASGTEGVHILDVSDPANPLEVGHYNPGYYIHDCHVNGDLLFAAAFYEGKMDVVNIEDKTKPVKIADFEDINGNTHSSWLTEDKKFLFLTSELDGKPGRIYNIENLQDIRQVSNYTANISSLVHNPYIRDDFAFVSHNTEGLRVVDMVDPEVPVEVGYYDTYAGASGGFNGLWSACPYFPSGKIIGGNREDGLYVWTFNDAKAGRIYGRVEDAFTGEPIGNAEIVVEGQNDILTSSLNGTFAYGQLPGSVTLTTSANGYNSRTNMIDLKAEAKENLVIKLDKTVATKDLMFSKDLLFQPNPCSFLCRFNLETFPDARQLSIFDTSGRSIRKYGINDGESDINLLATVFTPGLYFFQLHNKQGTVVHRGKLIIQ